MLLYTCLTLKGLWHLYSWGFPWVSPSLWARVSAFSESFENMYGRHTGFTRLVVKVTSASFFSVRHLLLFLFCLFNLFSFLACYSSMQHLLLLLFFFQYFLLFFLFYLAVDFYFSSQHFLLLLLFSFLFSFCFNHYHLFFLLQNLLLLLLHLSSSSCLLFLSLSSSY